MLHLNSSFITLFILTLLSIFYTNANAALYSDCVYSWEFGDEDRKLVIVRPIGQICYKRCQNECNSFARGKNDADLRKDKDAYNSAINGVGDDLNADIIDSCIAACQKGDFFKSKYRDYDENHNVVWKDEITTKAACGTSGISSANYNYYQSDLVIDPTKNQKIRIKMLDESGQSEIGSSIYLCGFKTMKLTPVWNSMLKSKWPDGATVNGKITNDKENWHARNYYWTDTEIDIKDGDYLELRYGGNYMFQPYSIGYSSSFNQSLQVWKPEAFGGSFFGNWKSIELTGSQFKLAEINILSRDKDGIPTSIDYSNIEAVNNANNALDWYGLKGRIWSETRPLSSDYNITTFESDYGSSLGMSILSWITDPTESDNPTKRSKERVRMLSFSGVLQGFSDKYIRLALRHYDNPNVPVGMGSTTDYADNLGGIDVTIKWRGCNFRSGERLQYAIIPVNSSGEYLPDSPNIDWQDVDIKSDFFPAVGKEKGNVFFRIKRLDLDYSKGLEPTCPRLFPMPCQSTLNNITNPAKYAAYNTTGEYYIAVEKEVEAAPVSGSLAEILQEIVDYLFKDDPNNPRNGIVPKTFKHFVTDTNFITAVRALLVLYIAFTGISFITGLAQTTQKEAIIRIAKISIVTVLISDRSWDFFNNYLFNLFTVGSLELIVRIASSMNGSMQFNEQEFFNNPSIIFSVFDAPFKQLFSAQVWVKIASLICANLFGFLIAIVIIFAIGMYAICIAKVLMLYLVSIISLGILFLVGPIFICFILFPFTKQFFDSWFKQMLSFALQPVFVITAVAFLNTLLMTALYVTLGFTACKVCILGFSILGFDVCLIPGYMSLASAHHPPTDSFGIPINSLASAIFFLIIGQAMYVFCNFSSSLANMIVTSSFMGLNLSEAAANANPVNALLSAFGSPRGGSAGAGRAGARASGRGGKDRVGGQYDKARRAPFGENLRLDDINANNRKEEENTQEQSKGSDRDSNNSGIE
ncbi:MAG: hypothetical protein IRD3MM_03205 [Candidatus Midichloria mitochondrii]